MNVMSDCTVFVRTQPGRRPSLSRRRALTSPIRTKPYVPAKPTTITIDLGSVDSAAQFMGRGGVEIVEPLKVVSKGKDWMQAWDQIWKW